MIEKRGNGSFRVKVKAGGLTVATQTFDRKGDAVEWEAAQKRALSLGDFVDPRAGKASVGDVVERWMTARKNAVASKTWQSEGYALKAHLPVTLANRPIGAVRAADLDALYTALLGKLARSTVSRFRNTLSSMFGWAVRERLISKNVAEESRVPKGNGQDDTDEVFPFAMPEFREVHKDLMLTSPAQADIALVLALTGLRWGELVALRVRDVSQVPRPALLVSRSAPDGQPVRTTTKGGKARSVPLADELLPIVAARSEGKSADDFLFTGPRGERLNGPNWKRAVKWSMSSRGRRVHDLRHTAATFWLSSGIDLKTVQTWLGHSTAKLTTDLYAHWMGSDADSAAMDKLNAILGTHSGPKPRKLRAAK